MSLQSDSLPVPLIIDSIHWTTDSAKNSNLYGFAGSLKVDIDGESLNKATNMQGLEIEDAAMNIHVKNLSALSIQTLNQLLAAISAPPASPAAEKAEDKATILLSEIANNHSGIKYDAEINTDQGNATLTASIQSKSTTMPSIAQWKKATQAPQPTAMIKLLQQNFDFRLDIKIPETLIKAAKLTPMMAITAPYLVKKEEDYRMTIENTDDGIKLNGQPIALPDDSAVTSPTA